MTTWIARILITLGCMTVLYWGVYAQDSEIISADTVDRLQSAQQIDYADLEADIDVGWFAVNDDASEFILFDNDSNIYRLSDRGEILEKETYVQDTDEQVFSIIDGTFTFDQFYILYTFDGRFYVNEIELDTEGSPLALGHDDDALYLEAQIDSDLVIYQLDEALDVQNQFMIPNDTDDPIMRVGRIRLPLIVQSSFDGRVGIFNYENILGNFVIDEPPAVFGHINQNLTHFTWVDPNSIYLNLLNLETGNNRIIAELDNRYAQYYLLSQDASLVIAVNVDFTPNLIAWDTNTGKRYDLGEYRACERIPDKVQLSADEKTLVIGCDTGLDLWRITGEAE